VYAKKESLPEVWDVGMALFLQRILRSPIKDHLISAILNEIRVEREGYVIHRSDVKGCVDVLLALSEADDKPSVYKRDLEPAVLKESEAYYKAEGEKLLETCDAPEYLTRVSQETF
jgi:cullin 3